ncbi:hypothetical protein NKG05_21715 [Oerskovia sp. M15]
MTDEQILAAHRILSSQAGVFVEPGPLRASPGSSRAPSAGSSRRVPVSSSPSRGTA